MFQKSFIANVLSSLLYTYIHIPYYKSLTYQNIAITMKSASKMYNMLFLMKLFFIPLKIALKSVTNVGEFIQKLKFI